MANNIPNNTGLSASQLMGFSISPATAINGTTGGDLATALASTLSGLIYSKAFTNALFDKQHPGLRKSQSYIQSIFKRVGSAFL